MNTQSILEKYRRAIARQGDMISADACEMLIGLALDDAEAQAITPPPPAADPQVVEMLEYYELQSDRITTWLLDNEPNIAANPDTDYVDDILTVVIRRSEEIARLRSRIHELSEQMSRTMDEAAAAKAELATMRSMHIGNGSGLIASYDAIMQNPPVEASLESVRRQLNSGETTMFR